MKRGILITALGATAFLLLSGFGGCAEEEQGEAEEEEAEGVTHEQ